MTGNTKEIDTGSWAVHRVIDVHGHLGSFQGYDLSLETLLANLNRFGVQQVLVSNIDGAHLEGKTRNLSEDEANAVTLQVIQKHGPRILGLAWTRPAQEARVDVVEHYLGQPGFVGVKFHPEMNQFAADAECVRPYLALCERRGVPAVFHCGDSGGYADPERIYAAARRFPRVPVVLYHMVMGGPHEPAIEAVEKALTRQDANLYLETSQADPGSVLDGIRRVGSDRVLFGTDATYYGAKHYERYETLMQHLLEELSTEDFEKVVRGNAQRLFRLQAPD